MSDLVTFTNYVITILLPQVWTLIQSNLICFFPVVLFVFARLVNIIRRSLPDG